MNARTAAVMVGSIEATPQLMAKSPVSATAFAVDTVMSRRPTRHEPTLTSSAVRMPSESATNPDMNVSSEIVVSQAPAMPLAETSP